MKFDDLPDAARVRIPVVLAVTGLSRSSYYAKAKEQHVPAVVKLAGSRSSGVVVGDLRRYLADPCAYRAVSVAA